MMKTLLNDTFGNAAVESHVMSWRASNPYIEVLANTSEQLEGSGMH